MKSAIAFALAIAPALTGILEAAEPLGPPQVASTLGENLPPEPAAKKPAGSPIGLVIRIYEMDITSPEVKGSIDFRPQREDRKIVTTQFDGLRKSGFVKVLAEPHLVTLDGKKATCLSGGEVPVVIPTGQGSESIDWHEFGTRVEVTPRRAEKGRIQIKIAAEFSRLTEHGLSSAGRTNPLVVGRTFRTAATIGPEEIIVLNDWEAQRSDSPAKVIFLTVELAQAGVEAALLQFGGQPGEGPSPPRAVPAREARGLDEAVVEPSVTTAREAAVRLPETTESGQPVNVSPVVSGTFRAARKKVAASTAGSFFLKPGKTQLELTRGTWRSLTIPSKDFAYGSSMLVESPEEGAVSISGRIMTPFEKGPANTESFEAGEAGKKYAADIWTIKGVKAGIATIRLLDDDDQEYDIEVTVKGDTRHFDAMVKRFHPKAKVEAHELTSESIVITGQATPEDSVAIREIAEQIYTTVLLRLKTQPATGALLEGSYPGSVYGAGASAYPDSGTGDRGETKNNAFAPTNIIGDVYAEPVRPAPNNSRNDYGPDKEKNDDGSSEKKAGVAAVDTGIALNEGAGGTLTTVMVGVRRKSQPPAPTTQVRFLHSGFISMQTAVEPHGFARVNMWDSWHTYEKIDGNFQQIRYSAHSENVPQGSQTRLQFRTTDFRDDVWVNAVLVTAAANEKTRYFLKHFPVDLVLQDNEIVAAARGQLVSRFVVMKDPRRAVLATKEDKAVPDQESFTGPNSFNEAFLEGRKQGQVLAILVLGPQAMLQHEFSLSQSTSLLDEGGDGEGIDSYFEPPNPDEKNGQVINLGDPVSEFAKDRTQRWEPQQPAGSVSTEMRQLRQEVRSLREQLGKLVEVLSRENSTKPQVDRPVPNSGESTPVPVGPENSGGLDPGISTTRPTPNVRTILNENDSQPPQLFPLGIGTESKPPIIKSKPPSTRSGTSTTSPPADPGPIPQPDSGADGTSSTVEDPPSETAPSPDGDQLPSPGN